MHSKIAAVLMGALPLAAGLLESQDVTCDCYVTSESDVFTNYKLFDFRALARYASTPDLIDDISGAAGAAVTGEYFDSDEWTEWWSIQSWQREATSGTIAMANSANNVYIGGGGGRGYGDGGGGTYLVLRTARHDGFQSAAEIDTVAADYQHISLRMWARTIGAAGACTAMFTYLDSDPVQEADIEFLTAGPADRAHYTNQPENAIEPENASATRNASIPVEFTDWAEHRLDWTDGLSEWFVNGERVAGIGLQVPIDPTRLILNSWSDGGVWTGLMEPGGQAFLHVQWIEVAYNVSGAGGYGVEGGQCGWHVCELD